MIVEISLTAPEYAPLIEGYHEVFRDDHSFPIEWDYPVLPGIGESFDEEFILSLLRGKVDLDRLPHIWTIVDRKWIHNGNHMYPRLYVVGK